jgi:hypothetical protein
MRHKALIGIALAAACATAAAVPALGGDRGADKLKAHLDGDQVVPGPGDRNGEGRLNMSVKPHSKRICFRIDWQRVDASSAYIRRGREGGSGGGGIFMRLFIGRPNPPEKDCKNLSDRPLASGPQKLVDHPERYYAVIYAPGHGNRTGGAIRGQLEPR